MEVRPEDVRSVRSIIYAIRMNSAERRPGVDRVLVVMRAINGKGMRRQYACAVLKHLYDLEDNPSGTNRELNGTPSLDSGTGENLQEPKSSTTGTEEKKPEPSLSSTEQTGTSRADQKQEQELRLPISSFDKSNSEMGSAAPEQPKQRREAKATPPAPKAEKPKPDPATWTEPLREAVNAMWRTPLRDLTPDERFALARYHCLKFANCTRDEGLNKRHALKIASGLANLATHRQHGAMTVDDYVNAADEAWRQGGERPMFRAWAATAFADAFTAPPPPNSRSPSPPQQQGVRR